MSATTSNETEENSFEKRLAIVNFEGRFEDYKGSSETAMRSRGDTVAIVFDWDSYVDEHDLTFNRDSFTENPTMVTGREFGSANSKETYLFSSGGNASYFSTEFVEKANGVLGYDMKSNLDRVYLDDCKSSLLVAEGDGFDVLIAPHLPPSDV